MSTLSPMRSRMNRTSRLSAGRSVTASMTWTATGARFVPGACACVAKAAPSSVFVDRDPARLAYADAPGAAACASSATRASTSGTAVIMGLSACAPYAAFAAEVLAPGVVPPRPGVIDANAPDSSSARGFFSSDSIRFGLS